METKHLWIQRKKGVKKKKEERIAGQQKCSENSVGETGVKIWEKVTVCIMKTQTTKDLKSVNQGKEN